MRIRRCFHGFSRTDLHNCGSRLRQHHGGGPEKFCCYQYADEPDVWDVNAVYKEDAYLDRSERYLIELLKELFRGENG